MAFTVDFGDDSKSGLEGRQLGDFMPAKLRKSFRERQEKTTLSTKSSSTEKITPEKSKPIPERHKTSKTTPEKPAVSHFVTLFHMYLKLTV